ncbi:hypothetical protein OG243_13660 [Streptomyces sp. NBC_01318]|uniref:hypothetical protein n=1 Tax=Streptomyces sp. NBC_01318 TaxID=2903823 RepID=UPI002E10B741|nr:hypothetical protein OG243_13660 [Streptomyces sp. NBC_01318]
MAEAKPIKKDPWLMMLTAFAGLDQDDYEVELQPVEGDEARMTITLDGAKEWQTARLLMSLLDSHHGKIEANKVRGRVGSDVEISFMLPEYRIRDYVTPKA